MNIIIILNIFMMMLVIVELNLLLELFRENVEYFFFVVFCFEFVLKYFVVGFVVYWKMMWN